MLTALYDNITYFSVWCILCCIMYAACLSEGYSESENGGEQCPLAAGNKKPETTNSHKGVLPYPIHRIKCQDSSTFAAALQN